MLLRHRAILRLWLVLLLAVPASAGALQNIAAVLPSIICLLLCDELPDDSTAPALQNRGGTTTLAVNQAAAPINFTNNGGGILSDCTVSPPLPAGLSVSVSANGATCRISGTPTETVAAASYTITATNASGSDQATIMIEVLAGFPVSGRALFERVPTRTGPTQLDYDAIVAMPIRRATVQLLDSNGAVIDTTQSDDNGDYAFSVNPNQAVRVRVLAELLSETGPQQYEVVVVDNTDADSLYSLTEGSATLASARAVRDLTAGSGWDLSADAYTMPRASAPFALLDSVYEAMQDFMQVDANIDFPFLQINWSVNNRTTFGDESIGEIGTSFYSADNIFILGAADSDTDEFDDHVVIHEWGHYFEDNTSRSDSIGGPHGADDRLDMRVAFGEGFGNALSGIITDDPLYIDTAGPGQAFGFPLDVDNNSVTNPGWYNESSVQAILYDLYDSEDDGPDTVSLGLAPLYQILIDEQKNTPVFTSIFSFISALKADNAGQASAINQLVNDQSINGTNIDEQGSAETNSAGVANVLPIYTPLTVDGAAVNVCTIANFNNGGDINKLSNTRYLTFTTPSLNEYTVTATRTSSNYGVTDPDIFVFEKGVLRILSISPDANTESATAALNAGPHVMGMQEFNVVGQSGSNTTACFDVTVSTAP
ncbi:MAG: hypothetical protein HKN50_00495 [Gammaproteobacteria bacterium]|nr:hypothetical protein [Gammaproteobacteria bacterium]